MSSISSYKSFCTVPMVVKGNSWWKVSLRDIFEMVATAVMDSEPYDLSLSQNQDGGYLLPTRIWTRTVQKHNWLEAVRFERITEKAFITKPSPVSPRRIAPFNVYLPSLRNRQSISVNPNQHNSIRLYLRWPLGRGIARHGRECPRRILISLSTYFSPTKVAYEIVKFNLS